MASSARMMVIGIIWLTCMLAFSMAAFVGSIVYKFFIGLAMSWNIHPTLMQSFGQMWWLLGFYYTVILVSAIVVTYRCYQEVIVVTDYFPDTGVY